MKIAENRLLIGTVVFFIAFMAIGSALPWLTFAPIVSLMLVVASGLTFMRYAPDAAAVLFQGRRNESAPEGDGSHLAIYGTAAIALGGVVTAITAFMLASPSLRPIVSQTPLELLGRGMASAGLALIFVSPNVTKRGVNFGGGFWFYLAAALTMIAVYAFGYSAGFQSDHDPAPAIEDVSHIPSDRPVCASDRVVWGSGSGAYHTPDSVHRRQVVPVRCFTSVEEAREAGFRAPG